MNQEINIKPSASQSLDLVLMSLVMTMSSLFAAFSASGSIFLLIIGIAGSVLFGAGLFIGLYSLFFPKKLLSINIDGIKVGSLIENQVPWQFIHQARIVEITGNEFLALDLDESYEYKGKQYSWLKKLNDFLGAGNLNIPTSMMGSDPVSLCELINQIRESETPHRITLIRTTELPRSNAGKVGLKLLLSLLFSVLIFMDKSFMLIIVICAGVSAILLRWGIQSRKFKQYLQVLIFSTIGSMTLLVFTILSFEYLSLSVAKKMETAIERHKKNLHHYPINTEEVVQNSGLNFPERLVAKHMQYELKGDSIYTISRIDFPRRVSVYNGHYQEWD